MEGVSPVNYRNVKKRRKKEREKTATAVTQNRKDFAGSSVAKTPECRRPGINPSQRIRSRMPPSNLAEPNT